MHLSTVCVWHSELDVRNKQGPSPWRVGVLLERTSTQKLFYCEKWLSRGVSWGRGGSHPVGRRTRELPSRWLQLELVRQMLSQAEHMGKTVSGKINSTDEWMDSSKFSAQSETDKSKHLNEVIRVSYNIGFSGKCSWITEWWLRKWWLLQLHDTFLCGHSTLEQIYPSITTFICVCKATVLIY